MTGGLTKGFSKVFGKGSIIARSFTRVGGFLSKILPIFKVLGKGFGAIVAPLLDITSIFSRDKGTQASGAASIGFGAIGAIIGSIFPGIGTLIGYGIGSIVGMLVNKVFPMVGQTIVNGVKSLLGGLGSIVGGVKDMAVGAATAGLAGLGELKTTLTSYFSSIGSTVMAGANSLKAKAADVYNAVTEAFSNLGTTVIDGITSVFDSLIAKAKELITSVADFSFKDFIFGSDEEKTSGSVSQDFVMRPGQGIQRFSAADTVVGLKDPSILSALAGNLSLIHI